MTPSPPTGRPQPLLPLTWERATGGHRLALVEGEPWLIEVEPAATAARTVQPVAPAAFRNFAALDLADDAAVVAFADAHGLLGSWVYGVREPGREPRRPLPTVAIEGEPHRGEPLSLWRTQQAGLAAVVDLVEAIRADDQRALRRWLRVEGDRLHFDPARPGVRALSYATSRRDVAPLARALEAGDARPAAEFVLVRLTTPPLQSYLQARIEVVSGVPRFTLAADSLLAVFWTQLGLWLNGSELRACETCGRWFEIEHGRGRRSHSTYCSPACKHLAYRRRQELARQLLAKRESLAAIADTVGSDAKTVYRWLYGPRPERAQRVRSPRRKT